MSLDEPPAGAAAADDERNRAAADDDTPVFENPIEGGGVMVDPGRRFESYLKARVTGDGVEVGHDFDDDGAPGAARQ